MPELQPVPRGPDSIPAPPQQAGPEAEADGATPRQRLRRSVRPMNYQQGRQALSPAAAASAARAQAPALPAAPQAPEAEAPGAPGAPAKRTPAQEAARRQGKLEGIGFEEAWAAHPHNYQSDPSKDTSSAKVQTDLGWKPDAYSNTCAIRMSVMLNTLGGAYAITPERARAAGIPRNRLAWSGATKAFYLLSAREMWTYVRSRFGKAHKTFPAKGFFRDALDFQTRFHEEIAPHVDGRRGLVAFQTIFGYGGTGHVDVFDGARLSDAPTWYASQRLEVWFL